MTDELDEAELRQLIRDEIDRIRMRYSRRGVITGAGAVVLGGAALASEPVEAAPEGNIGEAGTPLVAVYTEAIKDTADTTLISLPEGGPVDFKVPLNLFTTTSDPVSPSAGDMWYRSDLD